MSTDFYGLFKGEVEKTCGEYGRTVATLKKELAGIAKRLEDEKSKVKRLQEHSAKLETQTATHKCLTGTKNEYERFRTDLKKRRGELEDTGKMVELLQQLLDKKRKELDHVEDNLTIVLRNLVVSQRPVADERIEDLLSAAFAEYDAFLAAWRRIFDEYGNTFVLSNHTYSPGPWLVVELETLRGRLDVCVRRRASRKAAEVPKVAEPAAPEPVQQDEPTASEPVLDTPSQTPEPVAEPDVDVVTPEAEPVPSLTVLGGEL